tara:strand:+ start:10278 stop:12110 length:1833 start_codon:yes stop_codon:yes gene_type:complete
MPNIAESKLRLKAIDKMSGVIDKVKGKFPKLTGAVRKSSRQFAIMKRGTDKLRKSIGKLGGKMRGIGKGMSIGLTAPIAAFGVLALRSAVNFEGAMNKVKALTGSTGAEFEKMKDLAKDLGAKTQFSATQAGDAMAFLGQAGFKTNEILSATPSILSLAAASGTDLAKSADIMSNVMGGFNIKATDSARVADVLAKATAKGNINMEMIAETMKDAAPVALKFGLSLEETAALTAKLGDAGIQGSKAGTTLKNMMLNLASPTKRIKELMGSLGVKAVDPVTKKMRSMTDILVDMNKSFQSKGIKGAKKLAVLNEIFGKRAIAGAGVLLDAVVQIDPVTGKATNAVKKLTNGLINAKGHAKSMANTMMKGMPGAFKAAASAFESVQLAIFDLKFGGKKLSEIIVELTNGVTGFMQRLSTTNKGMLKWAVIIAGVVAVIGPLIGFLGIVLAILPSMITGIGLLATAFGVLKLSIIPALIPLLPLIAAVGLLGVAAVMLIQQWQPIKTFFSDLFTSPLQQIKDMIGFVGQLSGISSLFGLGDDTDEKLKSQGFKIKESGEATGSAQVAKQSEENKIRQQKAVLDVNFSNLPKDTRVQANDRSGIIESMTGSMAI